MKYFLLMIAGVCLFLLNGCVTVCETESPALTAKFSPETRLRLEGFQLMIWQATQRHVGHSSAAVYDYRTNSWTTGSGSYSGTTYDHVPDEQFSSVVTDIFELSGANIRTDTPDLTIEGRIGGGHYIWSSPAMWYRDVPIFIVTLCTFGMAISSERENDVRLIVYGKNGRRLKEYYASAKYHAAVIGFPFASFANEKIYDAYEDRMATKFALIQCVNAFIQDWNNGFFQ